MVGGVWVIVRSAEYQVRLSHKRFSLEACPRPFGSTLHASETTGELAMRTQVAIIGAGPAGLLLSQLLGRGGIDTIVLERQSRRHVLSRIRAGVLESTTVDVLRGAGLSQRVEAEGHPHDGMKIVWAGRESFFIDVRRHLGRRFTAYGQTQLQEDLYAAADRQGTQIFHQVG